MSLKVNTSIVAAVLLVPFFAGAQVVTPPTLTLTLSKSSITASPNQAYATLPTITWSSQNATACNASGAGWSGSLPLSGSQKVSPAVTTTYSMTCNNSAGSAVTQSVTVTVTPASSLQTAGALSGYESVTISGQVTTTGTGSTAFHYVWNNNLRAGSSNTADVSALQKALIQAGVFSGEVTGGFYGKTLAAVKQFQKNNGIASTGFVGPQTRAKLNALFGN